MPDAASTWPVRRWRPQRFDRPPDPPPYKPTLVIAAFEHQILQPGSFQLGVGAVLPDQQICGAPDIEVGNHPVSLSTISRGIMVLDLPDDEARALAQLVRRAIDDDCYPLSPRLAPLRAILAKLDPPQPPTEPPPSLQARGAPSAAG
jgi:hypothetical protein